MNVPTGNCSRCGGLYRLQPFHGEFFWCCDCPPARTYTSDNTNPLPGVYVLEPEEFDRVMYDLQHPSGPTESIKQGAELLRKLYGHRRGNQ